MVGQTIDTRTCSKTLTSSGTVEGNFIGTTRNGGSANANQSGILVSSGGWTIGGASAAARNVVSGNTRQGLDLHGCSGCSIQGNFIGTNATGKKPLANGLDGIAIDGGGTTTIGGATPGTGNLISGNYGAGIALSRTANVTIQGNRIGTTVGGTALGNGGAGVFLAHPASAQSVDDTLIGSASMSSAANTIAYNAGDGVRIQGNGTTISTLHNQVRGNSIHHNGGAGISLESSANGAIAAPSITGISPVAGTACAGCAVDIYSDSAEEGRIFEGSVTADGTGQWSFPYALTGPMVTATNTDAAQNTSEFSAPVAIPRRPDGRIRKSSGTFVGNNIYNTTGVNQTKSGSAARGSTITFGISIQNDWSGADRFRVLAGGTVSTMYRVRYFRGTTEITSAVVAGTYTTPALSTGAAYLITARVKVLSTATSGSRITRLVIITSVGDGTTKDAVKFVGKRR